MQVTWKQYKKSKGEPKILCLETGKLEPEGPCDGRFMCVGYTEKVWN